MASNSRKHLAGDGTSPLGLDHGHSVSVSFREQKDKALKELLEDCFDAYMLRGNAEPGRAELLRELLLIGARQFMIEQVYDVRETRMHEERVRAAVARARLLTSKAVEEAHERGLVNVSFPPRDDDAWRGWRKAMAASFWSPHDLKDEPMIVTDEHTDIIDSGPLSSVVPARETVQD